MPATSYPKDRFDDLPATTERVGAHRAENPRLRGGHVLLWSVLAAAVLVVAGIIAVMFGTGRLGAPAKTPAPTPSISSTATGYDLDLPAWERAA